MSNQGPRPPMRSASATRPAPIDYAPTCAKLPWRPDKAPARCTAPAHRGDGRPSWLVVLQEESQMYVVRVIATANACDRCADRLTTTRGAELCPGE